MVIEDRKPSLGPFCCFGDICEATPGLLQRLLEKDPKRRGVGSDAVGSFIPLSISTFGLLMNEVNVALHHSGNEAFPIKWSLGTISLNVSMRGNVPALSMFTGVSLQSMISSSVVRRG
jgi:hypothetical protein